MVLVDEIVSAATAVANYNIGQGKFWQLSNRARQIKRVGLVGDAAAGPSTRVAIYYGTVKVAQITNNALSNGLTASATVCGSALDTQMKWMLSNLVCEAGEPINVIVEVAPVTNAIALTLDIVEV